MKTSNKFIFVMSVWILVVWTITMLYRALTGVSDFLDLSLEMGWCISSVYWVARSWEGLEKC